MCKNVCLLGFAILSIRKQGRASVVICVCVYWRGTASWLGRARALQMRPEPKYQPKFKSPTLCMIHLYVAVVRSWPVRMTTVFADLLTLLTEICVIRLCIAKS